VREDSNTATDFTRIICNGGMEYYKARQREVLGPCEQVVKPSVFTQSGEFLDLPKSW